MNKFRELREKNGYTQKQLAEEVGVSRSTVTMWETGRAYPNVETLCKIADLWSVPIDELLGRERAKQDDKMQEILEKYRKLSAEDRKAAGAILDAAERLMDEAEKIIKQKE